MPGFKEHLLVGQHDDRRGDGHDDGFHAFGLRGHGDLFLHEVHEEVEDHTGQDGPVADQVNPGDDESQRDPADKEIDHIQGIDHQPRLVGSLDEDQRQMPQGPQGARITAKKMKVSGHGGTMMANRVSAMNTIHSSTYTDYFVTFELENGKRMELGVKDADFGMLAEGDQGRLSWQGTRYLGFERA